MNKDTTYYEILIGKYLSGEASAAELTELKAWIGAAEENQHLFTKTRNAWTLSESVNIEAHTNIDREWAAMKGLVKMEEESVLRKLATIQRPHFLRVAAILLLFIVPSVLYFWFFISPGRDILVADKHSIESTLPDGTQVALNTGSSLQYPSKFKGDERKVALKGEAYFDVAHNKEKPFIIEAGDMQIMVLGTSFYVNTNGIDNTMEVVLISVSVNLKYAGKEMVLAPGDKAVVMKKHAEIVKQENKDPNLLAWKTKNLRFNDTPLSEIVKVLEKVYQKDIRIMNPGIMDCRITATFEKQSLEAVLLVLQSTININVKPNGQAIEVYGESCE